MKIVYTGITKNGQKIVIRYPQSSDLMPAWRYINKLSAEKTYILFQGEKISKKSEEAWLNNLLKNIRSKRAVALFVFVDDQLSGIADVIIKNPHIVQAHLGEFGISLSSDIRGQGIGKLLMSLVISEAKKNLKNLKLIFLNCFSPNKVARHLYQSLGFIECGCLPNGLFHRDQFVDQIMMHKTV